MDILNTLTLKSNRQVKINFDGGDLSSDAGLLLINCTDELTLDPVFNAILEKDGLASQPTLSRFFNRMDEDTLIQFDDINKSLRDIIYSIKCPEHMLLNLDSTLFGTYGNQKGAGFNFHYQAHGYHPLLCYDGLTGDLLKAELRDGTLHFSNDADKFMESLFQEYMERGIKTYLRGNSGFSSPKLYKTCEMNGCSYAIRLKQNSSLIALTSDKDEDLYKAAKEDPISYAATYGEFMYQAGSWEYPRRVVFKIEKPYGQLTHIHTFIVTNMDMAPRQIIQFYCNRGRMENFIKEGKSGFDFATVRSHSKVVNANRMRIHMQQVDTTRLKLIKIAARAVRSARYITFKLCNNCPYKEEFYTTLENIQQWTVQLE
ncbi:MAG: IS1380 family transposase [Lachnospiraceae bacterium]|nr:IS1380 family transposase [Lachnospiraceae bacterium]